MEQYEVYFTYDSPIPYKNVLIYPVSVHSYLEFYSCLNCLLLEKNNTNDINIIRMSYLDYLFYIAEQDIKNEIFIDMLGYLFKLIFKEQEYNFYRSNNGYIYFTINNQDFLSQDFDEIKKIICQQYFIDCEELLLDSNVMKHLNEAVEYNQKHSVDAPTFEELIVAYHLYNGYDYEKIYNLSVRKFRMAIDRMCLTEDYKIFRTAELSGMVTFKESIQYWLSHIKPKSKLDGLVVKDTEKTINNFEQGLKGN